MFSVSTRDEEGFQLILLSDDSSGTRVEVIPACGAILHSFSVWHQYKLKNIIDHYSSKKEFDTEMEAKGFKGAKLSPFVCRMKEGKYHHEEKEYTIDKFYLGADAIHGLLYDAPFEVTHQQADKGKAVVELMYSYKGTDAGYPFLFDCKIIYELRKNNHLTLTTSIINRDEKLIPVCDGWHPYFTFGGKIDECLLEFQSKEILEFDESLIPTGQLIPYTEFGTLKKIGTTHFDNCFTVNFADPIAIGSQPKLILRDAEQNLQLEIKLEQSYPYLQIYIPSHRQSIAIENLSAAPDAFNNGIGLISLSPGEESVFRTTYTIGKI
jgi:aldose 1-epimerase